MYDHDDDFEDSNRMPISYPKHAVGILMLNYVHKVGFSARAIGIPGTDPDEYKNALDQAGMACSHSLPLVFVFQGYWPNRDKMFTFVTADPHMAGKIIADPVMIRQLGSMLEGRLIPLDPVSGSGALSIVEYNEWIANAISSMMGEGEAVPASDWSMLDKADVSSVEDFLRQEAENGEN